MGNVWVSIPSVPASAWLVDLRLWFLSLIYSAYYYHAIYFCFSPPCIDIISHLRPLLFEKTKIPRGGGGVADCTFCSMCLSKWEWSKITTSARTKRHIIIARKLVREVEQTFACSRRNPCWRFPQYLLWGQSSMTRARVLPRFPSLRPSLPLALYPSPSPSLSLSLPQSVSLSLSHPCPCPVPSLSRAPVHVPIPVTAPVPVLHAHPSLC